MTIVEADRGPLRIPLRLVGVADAAREIDAEVGHQVVGSIEASGVDLDHVGELRIGPHAVDRRVQVDAAQLMRTRPVENVRLVRIFGVIVRSIAALKRWMRSICMIAEDVLVAGADTWRSPPGSGKRRIWMLISRWRTPSTRSVCS